MGARFINFAPIYRSVLDDDWFFEHGIDLNWNSPIETSRDEPMPLGSNSRQRVAWKFVLFRFEIKKMKSFFFFLIIGIKKIRETKPCRLRKKILVFIILLGKVKTKGVGNEHLRGASPIWSQKNLRRGFRDFGSENRSFLKQMKLSGMDISNPLTKASIGQLFAFPTLSNSSSPYFLRVDTPSRCIVHREEEFSSQPLLEREEERERQRPVLINFSILARSRYDRLKLIPTPGTDASPLKRRDYARRVGTLRV